MGVKFPGSDGIVPFSRRIGANWKVKVFLAILAFTAMAVVAADTQVPYVFQPGEVISALKINDNFKILQDNINRLANKVNGVPIGAVVPYAGLDTGVPEGWRLCNGQELSRTDYPELFTVIGTLWGDGDSISTFNVPDLRGLFLRGVNQGRTGLYGDPDAASRVDYDGTIVGDRIGSFQDDAFQGHTFRIPDGIGTTGIGNTNSSGTGVIDGYVATTYAGSPQVYSNYDVPRLSKETRPGNVAVNYIIKVQ